MVRAIDEGRDYIFETTLGGNTIYQTLHDAIDRGEDVRIFFVGLASPELHIARVAARVSRGGHPIPEAKIRERWISVIHNLMGLIPRCAAVNVFDNSAEATAAGPHLVSLFALHGDEFVSPPMDSMLFFEADLLSYKFAGTLFMHFRQNSKVHATDSRRKS